MRVPVAYLPVRRSIFCRLTLALGMYAIIGYADEGRPIVKSFGQRETGIGDIFWSTAQDEHGVLYFGTSVVLSFDGERWEQYRIPGSHAVRALSVGEKGRLWVGAINEIGYFDRTATGTLTAYTSLVSKLPDSNKELG